MKFNQSRAALCAVCVLLLSALAHADSYPSRPIQLVVPYTPGTTGDALARLLGAKLSQRWNVPVVVENKTGASGIIGTAYVAKAAPDGYTILFTATSHGTIPAVNSNLPYDPVKSFAPVALLGTSAMTLVVNNDFPAKSVRELVEQAKKQPGVINYASPGAGSSQHLAMELFKQEAGINLVHVPYKGTAGALNDIIGGHVQVSVVSLQSATAMAKAGKIRMLGIMNSERAPTFPQVPTLAEAGYSKVLVGAWYGVLAPAGTPPAIIAKLNAEFDSMLAQPDVKEAMSKQGVDPVIDAPERLDTLLKNELKLWSQVVSRGKIVLD
jgi:tripartite-type tricarboxylate transporter receptor subunit TctC